MLKTPSYIMNLFTNSIFPTLSTYLSATYGDRGKKLFHEFQRADCHLLCLPQQTFFLRRCLSAKTIPPSFRLPRRGIATIDRSLSNCELITLRQAISHNYQRISTLRQTVDSLQRRIWSIFSRRDYFHILRIVVNSSKLKKEKCAQRLDRRLQRLLDSHVRKKVDNAPNSSANKVGKTFINLSDRTVSDSEKSVLEKGLGFAVSAKKIPVKEFQVSIEDFARRIVISSLRQQRHSAPQPVTSSDAPPFRANSPYFPVNLDPNLKACFREFGVRTLQILRRVKPPEPNLSSSERLALKDLKKDDSILILPADKGNATVMISKVAYVEKMMAILNDPVHFEKINKDPTKTWEKKLCKFLLNDVFKFELISKRLYKFLRPSDARTPKLYGLPKIHKDTVPLRPIVSAVRSFNYNLGKFLVWCLTPYMDQCDSYVKNSVDFAKVVSSSKPGYSKQVSFDVKSLFTNVPVKEAVDLALELILEDDSARHPLPADILRKLFEFATSHCCFQFDGVIYLQIDGLSMGNPLAPPLSHLFMIRIEKRAMNLGLRFIVWIRFVDDIYSRLSNKDFKRVDVFVEKLNGIHPSISFTVEKETTNSLPFLQVSTSRPKGNFSNYETTVYRKPTHTNLYVRWDSEHPAKQKLGIFHTLLWSARHICSSPALYSAEKEHLLTTFTELGYPRNRLLQRVKRVENPAFGPRNKRNSIDLILPYVSKTSEKIAQAWKKSSQNYGFDNLDVSVVYRPNSKLRNLLVNPYPRDPPGQCVYEAKCNSCYKKYVGETGLLLETREKTHKTSKNSAVSIHARSCKDDSQKPPQNSQDCAAVRDDIQRTATAPRAATFDFSQISRCHHANKRMILESLEIKERKPALNENKGFSGYVFTD